MRKVVVGLAVLLVLVVIAQFYFAAAGAMSPASRAEAYQPHHALGPIVFFLPIMTAAMAGLARMPGRLIGLLLSIAALTTGQVLLTKSAQFLRDDGHGDAGPLLFGLHALNGLLILAVAGVVVRQAVLLSRGAGWPPADAVESQRSPLIDVHAGRCLDDRYDPGQGFPGNGRRRRSAW